MHVPWFMKCICFVVFWYGEQYPGNVDEMDGGPTGKFCEIQVKKARGVKFSDFVAQKIS